jgi:hypothetical protein
LSGIDGRTLECCDLQAILTRSLQRLEESLGSSASRLTIVTPTNPLPIFAQARVLLIVLESFWRDILHTNSGHLHLVLHKLESKTASDIYAFTALSHEGKFYLHEAVLRLNYLLKPYEMSLAWDAEQSWLLLKIPQNLQELQAA